MMPLVLTMAVCLAGQADAAILSPADGVFRITGLPPSAGQYTTWRFSEEP